MGVTRIIGREGVEALARNEALRKKVLDAVRGFLNGEADGPFARLLKVDPNAKLGIRGSTGTGRVGNRNKPTVGDPWNPKDFDLDLSIVSDKIREQVGNSLIKLPDLREVLVRSNPELFNGLRPGGKGVSIKVYSTDEAPRDIIFFP